LLPGRAAEVILCQADAEELERLIGIVDNPAKRGLANSNSWLPLPIP